MTLNASGMIISGTKIQYLSILIFREALHQLDMLSDDEGSTTSENLKLIILGLGAYFFPVNALLK